MALDLTHYDTVRTMVNILDSLALSIEQQDWNSARYYRQQYLYYKDHYDANHAGQSEVTVEHLLEHMDELP